MTPLADLRAAVEAAAARVRGEGRAEGAAPTLERPPKVEFGDYSTNAAMLLAPVLGEPPRQIAERLGDELRAHLDGGLEKVEVAGPGFLNLFLSDGWFREALSGVLGAGEAYGRGPATRSERVLVEFVSANPTGPTTAASGRNAAYGDAPGRLRAVGRRAGAAARVARPRRRARVLRQRLRQPGAEAGRVDPGPGARGGG